MVRCKYGGIEQAFPGTLSLQKNALNIRPFPDTIFSGKKKPGVQKTPICSVR
jgi:hypothetical protein